MGKIVKLLIPFLFVLSLFANENFGEFDKDFAKASKKDKIQIYHELKGVYLHSILSDDKELQKQSLERLIKGGKILGIDYSVYTKELEELTPKAKEPKKSVEKQASKNVKKADKSNQKEVYKLLSAKSTTKEFRLNGNNDNIKIKSSTLNSKGVYRRFFDIEGELTFNYKNRKNQISNQIRVAQFDKKTIRVVFTHDRTQNIEYKIDGKSVIFSLKTAKKTTTKTATKPSAAKSVKSNSTSKQPARKNKIIVLDAGHGGKDPGAIGSGKFYEKNVVLKLTLQAGKILKTRGYRVYYTRSKDRFIGLRDRTSIANNKKADIFISIHANAAPNGKKAKEMQGIETYFLSPTRSERSMQAANLENKADTDEMNYFTKISYLNFLNREKIIASNKLAIDIQANMLNAVKSSFKVSDGGVREAPFWVLVGAQMPSVLIEAGYITHTNDRRLLANNNYINKLALGIANGIDDYFIKNP